jgi:hydroxysqualene dehydroxylase
MSATVHVVGAGVSGLSAAVRLAAAGKKVCLHEAANHAGGRCRSYFDQSLDHRIDNGNHLVLSGNRAVADYLELIGSRDSMWQPERAEFPFIDLQNGEKWTVRPDQGNIPWSLFRGSARVPGSSLIEYLKGFNLALAGPDKTVEACLDKDGPLYRRFWEPFAVSVLNTDPNEASAKLLWPVLQETFGRGERACRPLIAKQGLSESFVDPAIAYLKKLGCSIDFGSRLKAVECVENKVSALVFSDQIVTVSDGCGIVLAVPPNVAQGLVDDLPAPNDFRTILNAHFKLPTGIVTETPFIGLVGGLGHWLFVRDGIASVTVSAAEHLADLQADQLANDIWQEVTQALGLGDSELGIWRIIREKRATFAQTPEQIKKRPATRTRFANLHLAGDWTDTGLPATIEGSLRSGEEAAKAILETL